MEDNSYTVHNGCVYLANFWLESGFSNVFQANLEVDKRKAFFKRL